MVSSEIIIILHYFSSKIAKEFIRRFIEDFSDNNDLELFQITHIVINNGLFNFRLLMH